MEISTLEEFAKVFKKENGKTVIDFYADWCNPCKKISPYVEELRGKYEEIGFYKINIENKNLTRLCDACKIKSVPSFLFINNKMAIKVITGSDQELLLKTINEIFT